MAAGMKDVASLAGVAVGTVGQAGQIAPTRSP
jgi:hypothetical protein